MWRGSLQNDLLDNTRDIKKCGECVQVFSICGGLYVQKSGAREHEIEGQQKWLDKRGQTTNKMCFDLWLHCTNSHTCNVYQ